MSAVTTTEPDKQDPTNLYVKLPAELRINVIHEFIADFRKSTPFGKLAPFAAIHGEWQHELEAEEELFGSLCLTTNDLPALVPMLSQHRRDALSKVTFKLWVDNASIGVSEQGDKETAKMRTQDFVARSIGRILGILDHVKVARTQSIKTSGIEFHIQIGMPCTMANYRGLSQQLEWLKGVDCDFSQMRPINCIRTFSSSVVDLDSQHLSASGPPWTLLLTPSSLFTLVGRMPNLECAMVCLPDGKAQDDRIVQQFNICPTLKTLRVVPFDKRPSESALVRWTTSWSDNIEHLDLRIHHVVDFFSTVSAGGHSTGTTAWPKLEVLDLSGHYFPKTEFQSVSREELPQIIDLYLWRGGSALTDIFGAMAMALPSLPCIKEIRIKLGATALPTIRIKLCLRNGASDLTVFAEHPLKHLRIPRHPRPRNTQQTIYAQRMNTMPVRHRMLPVKYDLSDLFPEDTIQPAIADVRTAISTHFGLDLDVVWPKRDDESVLQ